MAHYLVTGGCGFIGSHLVEALRAAGDGVRVLDDLSTGRRDNLPAGVELVVGDVADGDLVRQSLDGLDGCFHLAAVASVQRGNEAWLETHRTNLTGSVAVFEAARGHAAGDRERFLWDLEKARLCVDAGRADLGMPLLLHLDKLARNASLDSWEPVICIDLTILLLRGDAQQGPGGDPERAALRNDWETRLARLDMRAAVELVKPPAEAGGT